MAERNKNTAVLLCLVNFNLDFIVSLGWVHTFDTKMTALRVSDCFSGKQQKR